MTLAQQLANIGSEFGRAAKRKEKGDREKEMKAFERGLELLDLSIQDAPAKKTEHPGVFKELLRLREVMCDYFVGDNECSSTKSRQKNFAPVRKLASCRLLDYLNTNRRLREMRLGMEKTCY